MKQVNDAESFSEVESELARKEASEQVWSDNREKMIWNNISMDCELEFLVCYWGTPVRLWLLVIASDCCFLNMTQSKD